MDLVEFKTFQLGNSSGRGGGGGGALSDTRED